MNVRDIWKFLEDVPDPEIPVINIVELGIVRDIKIQNEKVIVCVTPTYSGCPATKVIEEDIIEKLKENGVHNFELKTKLSPPWTTDWITNKAKEKLKSFGIAPPGYMKECPNCGSESTRLKSQFGSTPCKALYVCEECKEPFDYFKCH